MREGVVVRQWTTAAQWALVASAAFAAALVVNASVAYWLDTGTDLGLKSAGRSDTRAAGAQSARARDTSIILQRNLFGDQPITVAATSPDASGQLEQPPSELRLLGTAQVDDRGYAVIEDVAGSRQEVFVVGEVVFDGPTLVAVRPGQAVVDWNGRKQTLEISEPTPAHEEGRGEKRRLGEKSSGDGIRQTGAGAYLVDRREVEHSVENLNQIATQMRAVPYLKDGQTIGFRVFNIRSDSIFERMGLKNGDVIQKVNGVELDSPAKALALLEDVQTSDEIRVDLLRDNAPSTMTYTVR